MAREIKPRQSSYAKAISRKHAARASQRVLVRSGVLNPEKAQKSASLFHGIQSRVLRYGQGPAI